MTEAVISSPLARLTTGPRPDLRGFGGAHAASLSPRRRAQGAGHRRDHAGARPARHPAVHRSSRQGWPAFREAYIKLDITFDPAVIDPQGTRDPAVIGQANFATLINDSLAKLFPEATSARTGATVRGFISSGAPTQLRQMVLDDPIADRPDQGGLARRRRRRRPVRQGHHRPRRRRSRPPHERPGDGLARQARGGRPARAALQPHLLHHRRFARAGAGRHLRRLVGLGLPDAGHAGPVRADRRSRPRSISRSSRRRTGSTDLIEVNVNNLAAVPSIVFGLLGPRRVPQHVRHAAILAAGRRPDHGAPGPADHRRRDPRRPARRAALDPPGGARHRRLQAADHDPPCPAAGAARHPDRHDHRRWPTRWARPRRC